jgi:hypothetical protein
MKGGYTMKRLIPILLLALVVVLMSSGSFAIYTQTQTLRGELYMRIFLFTGDESATSYEFGLNGLALAPGQGETELYRFTLTNTQSGGSICDYDMTVTLASSGMAAALSGMSGLTFRLYDTGAEGSSPVATITSGDLNLGDISFIAGVSKSIEYRLTASWTDTGNSEAQTALAASKAKYPIHITVSSQAMN